MKKIFLISVILLMIFSCKTEENKKQSKYPRLIGNSSFDVTKDNADFVPCNDNRIAQYFNVDGGFPYKGEKLAIESIFKQKFKEINVDESGFVRIRFVVNCKGKTGRFRVVQSDSDYKKFQFDERIVNQLTEISKELSDWRIYKRNNYSIDYYQYLIFKIKKGKIIEILP